MNDCRAAVITAHNEPLEIQRVPIPDPLEPGALLVKITASTLCGTDVHRWHGPLPDGDTLPIITGHEPCGIVHIVPDDDRLLRALPELKEALEMNVELACPAHFIPELPGWQERSLFITLEGKLSFYHYDLYAQALAKIERGHALDVTDVEQMFRRGFIEPVRLKSLFEAIVPQLYRYPAIDPPAYRRAVEKIIEAIEKS